LPHHINYLRNKCQSAPGTSAIDAAKADWATALRVATRSRRDFVAYLAKDWAITFGTRLVATSIWSATRFMKGN
jgi:hypothetical protein